MSLPNFRPPVFSTLGCRLNAYETEAMKELAEAIILAEELSRKSDDVDDEPA